MKGRPLAEAYTAYANFLALPCKTVSKENVEFWLFCS